MNELYTVKEIARDIKVSERTVRRWIQEGKLKAFRIQGVLRIDNDEYTRFLGG